MFFAQAGAPCRPAPAGLVAEPALQGLRQQGAGEGELAAARAWPRLAAALAAAAAADRGAPAGRPPLAEALTEAFTLAEEAPPVHARDAHTAAAAALAAPLQVRAGHGHRAEEGPPPLAV